MSHVVRPPSPPPSPARAARHLRRLLWLLLAAVGLAAVAAGGVHLRYRHAEILDHATQRAEATSRLLDENMRGVLRATGFIVAQAAEAARPSLAEAAQQGPTKAEGIAARLANLQSALPERGALVIFNATGNVAAVAAGRQLPEANVADRAFFAAHRRGEDRFIGPLLSSRITGIPIFTVSRRIAAADGTFAGAAAASIEAQVFSELLNGLDLGPRAILGVYRTDGRTVLRLPDPERWVGTNITGGPTMLAAAHQPHGVVRGVSPLDGVERIVAYRSLPEQGVIVVCGVAVDDALVPWRRDITVIAIGLAGLAAVLGLLAALAFRNLNREQALMRDLEYRVHDRTEEARRQAEEARRANESKTRFLAGASHDLRQPLQAAGMFAEVLSARLADGPHQGLVDKLRQSIDATGTLLSTLLDISTLEAGKVKPSLASFPLMPMLASLADQMEPTAAERALTLTVVPTSAWATSDRVLLERLLRNLMVNALRYTSSGGVVIGCRHRGDRLAIQVVDSGIGIPADKLDLIFEDFTRLDAMRGASQRGPGLGLGVVRRTARLLGHAIEVRSIPGRGSTFTVILPAAPKPKPAAEPVEAGGLAG